jgi:hypothetical protein
VSKAQQSARVRRGSSTKTTMMYVFFWVSYLYTYKWTTFKYIFKKIRRRPIIFSKNVHVSNYLLILA